MEDRVERMLEIAERIMAEGRRPTEAERETFRTLAREVHEQPEAWRERFADLLDRLAARLEGMGI